MNPYRPQELRAALAAGMWKRACEHTRNWLSHGGGEPDALLALEAIWARETGGRFGFRAQLNAVAQPPPLQAGPADWDYVVRVGDAVGWRRHDWWCCWGASAIAESMPFVPRVELRGAAGDYPAGCFPFYDIVIPESEHGFSPRDAYGEYYWEPLCDLWRALLRGDQAPAG